MTSIFHSYFHLNLERVNARSTRVKKDPEGIEASVPKDFRKVLSDLEQDNINSNKTNALGFKSPVVNNQLPIVEPLLTNLTKGESQASEAKLVPPLGPPAVAPSLPPPQAEEPEQSVKVTQPQVKNTAPQPTLPSVEQGNAPQTPIVARAQRVFQTEQSNVRTEFAETDRSGRIMNVISKAGKFHGVDPHLSIAVAQAESALRPNAISQDGHKSKGIFQLLDSTANDMIKLTGMEQRSYDPFNPSVNAFLGTTYLRRLHDLFSKSTNLGRNLRTRPASSASDLEKLAVAAFNAGEGNVAKAQAKAERLGKDPADFNAIEPYLPHGTRQYVRRVDRLKSSLLDEPMLRKKV